MKLKQGIYITISLLIIVSLFDIYYFKIIVSSLIFLVLFFLFWEQGTPPIIIFGLSFQWLSSVIGYIYLSFSDSSMIDLLWRPENSVSNIDYAFWLSIFSLLVFSLGLKLGIYKIKKKEITSSLLKKYNTTAIIVVYTIFTFFSDALFKLVRFTIPGISQPINMFSYLKWGLLFILLYISFSKKERIPLVILILGIEVLIGFTGYFSEFKEILIMIPIAFLTFNRIKGRKQIILLVVIIVFLFNVGAVWSYVKGEYRMYLSGGEREQVVRVSKKEALMKLYELSSSINPESYKVGVEALVKRIFFLEYFSATINHIPERRPYMKGENYSAAVKHVIMPRMLFPEKEAVDDSKQTQKLTGIEVADASLGASISVGYVAQAYADFGPVYMFIPIFLLGLIIGFIYKYFVNTVKNPLWSYALIFPMYFLINIFGRNIIKITGDLFMYFIVFFLVVRVIVPIIDKWIRIKE